MANIRNLKKQIKTIASELTAECEVYARFHPEADGKKIEKIISDIHEKERSLTYEINHLKHNKDVKPKDFYNKIIAQVNKEMIPLLDKLGDLAKKN